MPTNMDVWSVVIKVSPIFVALLRNFLTSENSFKNAPSDHHCFKKFLAI